MMHRKFTAGFISDELKLLSEGAKTGQMSDCLMRK